MNIGSAIQTCSTMLADTGIPKARLDALVLLSFVTAIDKAALLARPQQELREREEQELLKLVRKRSNHIPISYLTNNKEFFGLNFFVNTSVLIPRPESEHLVELAVQNAPQNSRVLDIGTGSGALAVALKRIRPDLVVSGIDISNDAISVATKNARDLSTAVTFNTVDFNDYDISYDSILANLPYIPLNTALEKDIDYEPAQALFSGTDGLDHYKALFRKLKNNRVTSSVFVECEPYQIEAIDALAADSGFSRDQAQSSEYCHFLKRK